jgi:integrase
MQSLTDTQLRRLRPADKPYKVADGRGLYIEVRPTGSRLWRYRYRIAGRENIFAMGEYPDISLSEARAHLIEARKLVKQGMHPAHVRRAQLHKRICENENTFESVANEWVRQRLADRVPQYIAEVRNRLETYIFPYIGTFPIRNITSADLLAALRKVEKKAPTTARKLRQWCSAIFRYGIVTLKANNDPAAALRGALSPSKTTHHSALPREQIPAFIKAVKGYPNRPVAIYIQLLLLTFTRASELRCACWREIDMTAKLWRVPAERIKTREPHQVPLSDQAVGLLKELHNLSGERDFLFPNPREPRRPMSHGSARMALKKIGMVDKTTLHGFRALASSWLNEAGFKPDAIERQLAHRERNATRAAYNRSEYMADRRLMMQAWADHVDTIAKGAEVVPLFGRSKRS